MEKRQVLLICKQPLLGEGLERILMGLEDVDLVNLDYADWGELGGCLQSFHPAMVVLGGEMEDNQSVHLISLLLKQYEDVPVVWIELETTVMRVYTSHSLAASRAELIQAIQKQSLTPFDIHHEEFPSRK